MGDLKAVTLREIGAKTVNAVIALSVVEEQKGLVAPNSVSLAQAFRAAVPATQEAPGSRHLTLPRRA